MQQRDMLCMSRTREQVTVHPLGSRKIILKFLLKVEILLQDIGFILWGLNPHFYCGLMVFQTQYKILFSDQTTLVGREVDEVKGPHSFVFWAGVINVALFQAINY